MQIYEIPCKNRATQTISKVKFPNLAAVTQQKDETDKTIRTKKPVGKR